MLKEDTLDLLKAKKNLLAFSAGVDSSALFFLLQDANITFDIAIVDYGLREQSKEEVRYAQELAHKYNLTCHVFSSPPITTNFEAKAREVRYAFFESLIKEHAYKNLLTAHHLGDRFEWMLMQFCKGAGCVELRGMQSVQKQQNYNLLRPLLDHDKSELLNYLIHHKIKYFEDLSNLDERFSRNVFRHQHTNPLLQKYLKGIKKSFHYLDEDSKELIKEVQLRHVDNFCYFVSTQERRSDSYAVDKYLKSIGYILSANERSLLKQNTSLVVGRKYLVSFHEKYVFIAPFEKSNVSLPKEFKEKMRKLKIDPKLRVYFYTHLELLESLALT